VRGIGNRGEGLRVAGFSQRDQFTAQLIERLDLRFRRRAIGKVDGPFAAAPAALLKCAMRSKNVAGPIFWPRISRSRLSRSSLEIVTGIVSMGRIPARKLLRVKE
jgi:hypothetical protein